MSQTPPDTAPAKNPRSGLVLRVALPLVLLGAAAYGVRTYIFSRTHEVTDDAAVSGDVVAVMPEITAKVTQILVHDNQPIKAGQLLMTLDDRKYRVAVQQAQASLDGALADAKAAGIDVEVTAASAVASQTQAEGGLQQSAAGIGTANAQIAQVAAQFAGSQTQEQIAVDDERNAHIDEATAIENLSRAQQQLVAAKAARQSAEASVESSKAVIRSAQAQSDLAARNLTRAESLVGQGAISVRDADSARANAAAQRAALDSARQQLASAVATVAQRSADIASAQSAVTNAQGLVSQARVKIRSSQERIRTARSTTQAVAAQLAATRQGLAVAVGRKIQSTGVVQEARNADLRVRMKRVAIEQAAARVELARAAVAAAKIDLSRTRIVAPLDGLFSRRTTQIGGLALPGYPLFSIAFSGTPKIVANFKETQVPNLTVNQPVDVDIDGFAGRTFRGHIESVSAATGSTFALLPPDNSTGNFVKVVQRVPVKIKLEPGQDGLDRLRIGMSATVTVKLQ